MKIIEIPAASTEPVTKIWMVAGGGGGGGGLGQLDYLSLVNRFL